MQISDVNTRNEYLRKKEKDQFVFVCSGDYERNKTGATKCNLFQEVSSLPRTCLRNLSVTPDRLKNFIRLTDTINMNFFKNT